MLATRQHGTVCRRQLRVLGYSDRMIDRRVAAGVLLTIHRGVHAVGHRRLTVKGSWMAAVLACGDGARLSHRDATALWDVERPGAGLIHVTAAGRHVHAGVRSHRTRHPEHLGELVIDAIPVTTIERALLDRAVDLHPQRLRSLIEAVQRRNLFDLRRIEAEIDRCDGHRGIGRLRTAVAALDDEPPALRSGLEARFLELVRGAGLPEPSVNVLVAGELIDFRWPDHGLVVEIDSWRYHRSRRSFEADRRRANQVALSGETLLRFTDTRLHREPAEVISELRAALGEAASGR